MRRLQAGSSAHQSAKHHFRTASERNKSFLKTRPFFPGPFSLFVSPKKNTKTPSPFTHPKNCTSMFAWMRSVKNVSKLWSALFAERRLLAPGSSRVAPWPDHDLLPAISPTVAAEASCLPWKKPPPRPPHSCSTVLTNLLTWAGVLS